MTKAYSYVRFSSPEQMSGDSVRRQTSLAEAYVAEFGLQLDTELTYRDLGVSSFRSQNATSGRLGAFLAAVTSGAVPIGSILLVENLDRLSRDNALVAQNLLTQIVLAGITVVTLSDRREYSVEELKRDPMGLLFALINFIRANEESELKSLRMRASWSAKRAVANTQPLTASCPGWMKMDPVTRSFVLIPPRVRQMRKIYALASAGKSLAEIIRTLNKSKSPVWGRQKSWTRTGLNRLLQHSGVVGTFVPHRSVWRDGKPIRAACTPIPNYFPAIISAELFEKVQLIRRETNSGRRGRHTSIVNKVAKCNACGAPVVRVRYGADEQYILVCSAARAGLGCEYIEISYQAVEATLHNRLPAHLLGLESFGYRGRNARLNKAQNAVDQARRRLSDLDASAQTTGYCLDSEDDDDEDALLADALDRAEEELFDAVESCQPKLEKPVQRHITHALECLAEPVLSTQDVLTLNRALTYLFDALLIDARALRIGLIAPGSAVVWMSIG